MEMHIPVPNLSTKLFFVMHCMIVSYYFYTVEGNAIVEYNGISFYAKDEYNFSSFKFSRSKQK